MKTPIIEPYWNLTIVHFDSYDRTDDRRLHPEESHGPTALSPWRTWLCHRYLAYRDPDELKRLLDSTPDPIFLILHETDLDAVQDRIDLSEWLRNANKPWTSDTKQPSRLLLLCSYRWVNWGDCIPQRVHFRFNSRLDLSLFQKQWAAFPYSMLTSEAKPAAWLGQLAGPFVSLDGVLSRFDNWRADACHALTGCPVQRGEHKVSDKEFIDGLKTPYIRYGLLVEWLDTEGNRPRSAVERQEKLLAFGDAFWLLEGVAYAEGWDNAVVMLQSIRLELRELLGRCCSKVSLEPEARESWQSTAKNIEAILQAY